MSTKVPARGLYWLVMDDSSIEDFEAFFRRMLPRAVRLAERVTSDHEAAEDAAVEAFALAHSRWKRVAPLPWRDAWLLKVCLHKAFRQRPRRVVGIDNETTVDVAEAVVLRQALLAALVRLPRRQRDAVALRYLADMSEAEIAQAMSISQGSVKTHLHRALRSLRSGAEELFKEVPNGHEFA